MLQIEKVFGSANPNPAEVEKAKRVLRVRTIVHECVVEFWSLTMEADYSFIYLENCRIMSKLLWMQLQGLKKCQTGKAVIFEKGPF